MKTSARLLSLIMSIVMLICMIPQSVLAQVSESLFEEETETEAEEIVETITEIPISDNSEYDMNGATVIGEVVERRNETAKTFRMSDGSFIAADYGKQIHYTDENGILQDYDNTLSYSASSEAEDFNGYIISKSDINIKLANNSNSNNLLKIQSGEYKVSLHLVGADKSKALEIYDETEQSEGEDINSVAALTKFSSGAIYKDILPSTDLEYIISGSSVKENIIVKEKSDSYIYTFELKLNGLVPVLLDNGDIALNCEKSGETELIIPKGVMYDAGGQYSEAVEYSIVHKNGKKYTLTVTADADWINAYDRVFPVTVDPTIFEGKYRTNEASDTYAREGYKTYVASADHLMLAGYSDVFENTEIYVKNAIPEELPNSASIVYASLNLKQVSNSNDEWMWYRGTADNVVLVARKVTSNWSESTLCWNNRPTYDSTVLDYNTVSRETQYQMFYWDITSAVQDWYDNGNNYGIVISLAEPYNSSNGNGNYAHAGFYSSNNPYIYSSTLPMFMIVYRDTKGLESHWTYSSQTAEGAGTGYVNGYNGNLVFVHNDMTTEGSVMPISVNHVYNSFQADREFTASDNINSPITADYSSMKVGKGWKLSVQQTIVTKTIDNTVYYVYNDEDGTERYFRADEDDKIMDEDGYGLVLTVSGSGTSKKYVIENEDETEFTFDSKGRLTQITDVNGQQKLFEYSEGRLSQIKHKNGSSTRTVLSFTYNSSGALMYLTNGCNLNDYALFRYSATPDGTVSWDNSGYLREITYYNTDTNKTVYYDYNSDGTLKSAKDGDSGYMLTYEYENYLDRKRVADVQESVEINDVEYSGQTVGFEYGDNLFEVRTSGSDDVYNTSDDIITVTLFDNFGQATCSYSTDAEKTEIYGASYAKYSPYDAFAETNNTITTSVSKGITQANYISNGNCESATNWSGYVSNGYASSITSDEKLYGNKSIKFYNTESVSGHFRRLQNVAIPSAGTYTLSAYVKTVDVAPINNGGAFIILDGAESDYVTGTTNTAINNGWRRISVTKTFAAAGTYPVNLKFMGATGTAYFDCVQLEKGSVPSNYNFVENSAAELDRGGWGNIVYAWDSERGVCGTLTGSPSSQSRATQEIIVNQPLNTTFMLSGWAKANSVDILVGGDNPDDAVIDPEKNSETSTVDSKSNRKFGIMATITYSDGTTEEHYEPFNADNTNWQYISLAVVSKKRSEADTPSTLKISKITVAAAYDYNCNMMYFDDICLTVEAAQTYKYDAEGNIINVTDDNSNTTVAEYYDNGIDLEKHTAPTGEQFGYVYDDKHQVTEVTKTVGDNTQKAEYTYDNYGNITGISVTSNKNASLKMSSSATYTDNGNYLWKVVDELGNETEYDYDTLTKLLKSVENANSVRTAYNYDYRDRVTKIYIDSDEDNIADSSEAQVSYVYSNQDRLSGINTQSTEYTIEYNVYGKIQTIKAGGNLLATYTYAPNNGKLTRLTYGNGDYEEYFYDRLDRLVSVKYNGTVKYSIEIDANNRLHSLTENGNTHYYEYDSIGRLVRGWQEDPNGEITLAVENSYDEFGRSSGSTYSVDSETYEYETTYKENSNLISEYSTPAGEFSYRYDAFDRPSSKNHTVDDAFFVGYSYGYVTDGSGNTSNLVATYSIMEPDYSNHAYYYTYDDLGNITSISTYTEELVSYEYDSLGQLIRENNAEQGYTMLYAYDNAGNIIAKSAHPYTTGSANIISGDITGYSYSTSSWGDLLVNFNGTAITYDAIGNPINWRNSLNMTWDARRLTSHMLNHGTQLTYTYNSDGIRTKKEVYDTLRVERYTYKYILDGNRIISETAYYGSSHLYTFNYFYDETGVIGFDFEGNTFYFLKNLQGDIIEILNSNGTSVVQYTYDAWGKVLSVTGTLKDGIGKYNPFRYRGYYYDTETGFYYLNSRYYDPEVCRFINVDSVIPNVGGNVRGYNLFAYCFNNPVNMTDTEGDWPSWNDIKSGFEKAVDWVDNNIVQPVADFVDDVVEDYNNYDLNNQSEDVVFSSNYFSNYKGSLVIKTPFDTSFSFGFIGLSTQQQNTNTLNHEFGHIVQMESMGVVDYTVDVAIPSVTINILDRNDKLPYDYYSYPWEAEANELGGITLSQSQKPKLPQNGYTSYWDLIKLFFK